MTISRNQYKIGVSDYSVDLYRNRQVYYITDIMYQLIL